MITQAKIVLLSLMVLLTAAAFSPSPNPANSAPEYTSDAPLKFPDHYREWIYLTTGFDMSYTPAMQRAYHHMFKNVYVKPEAYKAFVETGTWPDKTMLGLEGCGAESKGSVKQRGNYQ